MRGSINVLLYEDKLTNAILISQKLKKYRYEVSDIVSNSEDAINSIRNNSPQIILLENHSQKPEELQETIQLFQKELNIPVICLLNGNLQKQNLNSCGALKLPLNLNQLNHIVDSVLNYEEIIEELSHIQEIIDQKESELKHQRLSQKFNENINAVPNVFSSIAAPGQNQYNAKQKIINSNLDNIFLAFLDKNNLNGHVITFENGELFLINKSKEKQKLSISLLKSESSIHCCQILREAYFSKQPVVAKIRGTDKIQYCIPKYNKYGQLVKFYLIQMNTSQIPEIKISGENDNSIDYDEEVYNYIKQKGEQFNNFIKENL